LRTLIAVEQLRRRVPGGIGTYALGLISGLDSMGVFSPEVTLLASRPGTKRDVLGPLGHPVVTVPLPGPALTRAWGAGHLAPPEGFDVVHSVSLASPPAGDALSTLTVHDLAWREVPSAYPARGRRWHEAALRRAVSEMDLVVTPARGTADALVAGGMPADRVAVVEEGADHLPPPDLAAASRLLRRLGVGATYLLSVGTLEPRKNLRSLVAAYVQARRSLPEPWPLVVVGPDGWGESIDPVEGVVMAGRVDDAVLSGLYARARCVAYVPLVEGFGLPVVEAMAAGVPVVASPVPSAGGATLEVSATDVVEMARALVSAATDEALRADLVAAGRSRVRDLTWESTARAHVYLWESTRRRDRSRRRRRMPLPGPARRLASPPARVVHRGRSGECELLALSLDVTAVPSRPAGAGRYILELAESLSRRADVSLTLVARRSDVSRWEDLAPMARIEGAAPAARPLRLAWEQLSLPALLSRVGADVHHGPHYTMPERAKLPRVVTVHDLTFFDHPEWHEKSKVKLFRRAIRVAAERADAIVCVSEVTARRLVERLDPAAPVVVARHGVDHSRFKAEPEDGDDAVLAEMGARPPYVVFIGTLEPRKDLQSLLLAFDRIASVHGELSLVVAGQPGWGSDQLEATLAGLRHRERVKRTGYVPDRAVAPLLRGAAAAAYPSLDEGFGLPALEAMACGAPLVTTTGSAMEEMSEGVALLVEPGDVDGLAGALDMLARGDQGLGDRLRRGLEVASRHTWEASAEVHVRAYREALRRHVSGGTGHL
jgi:glycosyltransferase involved in cell wall biosynthesis